MRGKGAELYFEVTHAWEFKTGKKQKYMYILIDNISTIYWQVNSLRGAPLGENSLNITRQQAASYYCMLYLAWELIFWMKRVKPYQADSTSLFSCSRATFCSSSWAFSVLLVWKINGRKKCKKRTKFRLKTIIISCYLANNLTSLSLLVVWGGAGVIFWVTIFYSSGPGCSNAG